MPRTPRSTVSCVAAAALLVSCSSTSGGLLGAGSAREPTVVEFTYEAVNPSTVRIAADGNVSWVNMAEDAAGVVVLPASIASRFQCKDLEPYFKRTGNVYQSHLLTGVESERAQLPCSLAPGTYDYEIWLVGAGFGDEVDDARPQQMLRGKIVVEPTP